LVLALIKEFVSFCELIADIVAFQNLFVTTTGTQKNKAKTDRPIMKLAYAHKRGAKIANL
jgi:hypothetical protein